ncbi:MAG: 3-methyl-2-oxobutanoate hydroxymethyltransferase [Planctomycetaceae bacterium]|jgi:3-methyl-2-oxobutanoate hydroxymethyltransferase|nr:3-methyl-2-oxobutanoate hydroxymethyltransferase [Planctomycetaceae bacterium]
MPTDTNSKFTVLNVRAFKEQGRKVVALTAYDWACAKIVDTAGVDIVLVGDSLGNVVQGKGTTLPVTLDEMIYHTEMVVRAVERALVVADLPFPYAQSGAKTAVKAAAKILKQTGAGAVKIEGGTKRADVIRAVVDAGIPVIGHCGLLPQNINCYGKFTVQRDREALLADAEAIENAGAFAVVIEYVPAELAAEVSKRLKISTIGIGSGNGCDGQVLVLHDILGFGKPTRHSKVYAPVAQTIHTAVSSYADEVRNGVFPSEKESF